MNERKPFDKSSGDARLAAIARRLAEALADAAYTRKPEDKQKVAALHVELIAAVKAEKPEDKPA